MNNVRIAEVFDLIADLLEFQDANPFRVRAYRNGARTIRDYPQQIAAIVAAGTPALTDISGVGKDLAEKIVTLCTTGKLPMLEELQSQVPESVLALLRIPGLGPKKAAALYKELNISTLDQLRAACEAHQVRELKGFGAKTEEAILAGMALAQTAGDRMLWAEADKIRADPFASTWPACQASSRSKLAGSYRRGRETVGDLDFLVVSRRRRCRDGPPGRVSPTSSSIDRPRRHQDVDPPGRRIAGRPARRAGRELRRGAAILHRLEGAQHRPARAMAKDRGLKINEYGVFRVDGDKETFVAGQHREGGLRRARAALDSARAARGPATSSSGPPRASCRS